LNKNILKTGVQQFISENYRYDIVSVLLKKLPFPSISSQELGQQLFGKKKCVKKLPTWYNTAEIYYPTKVQIEQTSSELTAAYKANLVTQKSLLDLTGGFGVDSYFFSLKMDAVLHCEMDSELSKIAAHNFKKLGAKNVRTITEDGIQFLSNTKATFDWIYIDPSRRNTSKGKVFQLMDCLPNVPAHLQLLFSKTNQLLIKTAPLLDISLGKKELRHVKAIHIVAVTNEVKELLWVLEKDYKDAISVCCVNLGSKETSHFKFTLEQEQNATPTYNIPATYLYEPNAAVLKAGAFKTIAQQYQLDKLHMHTHLYSSKELKAFPGRRFKIVKVLPYNKKEIKNLRLEKANITTRNFPESVAAIRKKHKIKDGGDVYLFFTTNMQETLQVLVCYKV